MSKLVIGIVGSSLRSQSIDAFGAGNNHLEFVAQYGLPRIIMPWEEKAQVDALYLPGGLDVSPQSYGEWPRFQTSNQDVHKQFFFEKRLGNYIGQVPVIGVCLGFQMLNVHFGGTLTQNVPFHPESKARWTEGHEVQIENAPGIWGTYTGKDKRRIFNVNSHHHQAVKRFNLAMGLMPLAVSIAEEDGRAHREQVIEAFQHETLPVLGFQWHPEEYYDEYSDFLIRRLLNLD